MTENEAWRTYTLAQHDEVCTMLRNLLPKFDEDQAATATKILSKLDTQKGDNQLVPFNFEQDFMLEAVEQVLWRR